MLEPSPWWEFEQFVWSVLQETPGVQIAVAADLGSFIAHVCISRKKHTVSLMVDERTAATLMFAARMLIADYEAHKQELLVVARQFPAGSHGRTNRLEQAHRIHRKNRRLRAVDDTYRGAVDQELWGL